MFSGAAQERWDEDICDEDPKEASHCGHETAGAHPLGETDHAGGTFRLYSQVPPVTCTYYYITLQWFISSISYIVVVFVIFWIDFIFIFYIFIVYVYMRLSNFLLLKWVFILFSF